MGINPYIQTFKDQLGLKMIPMMPAAGILIENEHGEILLQQRTDNGKWCLPGGSVDAGETFTEAAVREVYEETGLMVPSESLVAFAALSDPVLEKIQYPDTSYTHYYSMWFISDRFSGQLIESNDETAALKFYALDDLPEEENLMLSTVFLLYNAYPKYKKNKEFTVR